MNEVLERTVGDIVSDDWRAAGVFAQFGIDFCCGGRRSVSDACRSTGVDAAAVEQALEELSSAAGNDEASQWSTDRLIDHILQTHHQYVRSALPRITRYLAKLIEVHGTRHPELARIASEVDVLGHDLLQHMVKEERVLFPYIRELAAGSHQGPSPFGTIENPIRMMEHEHDEAGAQLREIRRLTNDYTAPVDGCTTYRVCFQELAEFERDLHLHVHLENNVVFPRAVELEARRG